MYIVIFIIILGLLITVHEFGHFITAKKQGMLVEEFGFGLPPRIIGLKIGETLYSLNLIPIGGFVKIYGEEHDHEIDKLKDNTFKKRAFINKKPWQKALVIIGGVLGNFLLGWLLISYIFTQGIPTPTNKILVEKVQQNSPAEKAGIKEKDVIIKIIKVESIAKEFPLTNSDNMIALTKKFAGEELILVVLRNNKEELRLKITPRKNPPSGQGPLGIIITSFMEKKFTWYQAPVYGLIEAFNITKKILVELLKTLFLFITFKHPKVDVTGPIGIARFTDQAVKFGKNAVLELTALLSLNLAVINIFPFPALDGGRLIFVLYEWITKRKVNKIFEKYLNFFGLAFLMALAVLISINDIIKIYK